MPAPAILYIHYPSCKLSIVPVNVLLPPTHLNQTAITLWCQYLDTEPQHTVTMHNIKVTVQVGIKNSNKINHSHAIWMVLWYHFIPFTATLGPN